MVTRRKALQENESPSRSYQGGGEDLLIKLQTMVRMENALGLSILLQSVFRATNCAHGTGVLFSESVKLMLVLVGSGRSSSTG